jgi:hypothetical protein
VEGLNFGAAHFYALVLFAISFAVLMVVYTGKRRNWQAFFR